ncbi:MAG: CBS domain-containing protein [Thaumarchaeota archaeon]|nr:CBS domain-containing protein [Nitrososphaerota archaeon]
MTFALVDPRQLKRIRVQLSMTQASLAREAGVSQSLIAKIEAGKADPAFSALKAISEALRSKRATEERRAADVMSHPVISVKPTAKLAECISLMKHHGISQLPVIEGGLAVGSVTENSILVIMSEKEDPKKILSEPVRKFMRPPFPVVSQDTPTEALLSLFNFVPVVLVSAGEKITGLIAKIDLLESEANTRRTQST